MLSIRKIESRIPLGAVGRMLAMPHLAYETARLAAAKGLVARFEDVLSHEPAPLRQISVKITNMCHLRCPMCAQWGMAGYNIGKSARELTRDQVTPEQTKRLRAKFGAGLEPVISADASAPERDAAARLAPSKPS